MNRRKRRFPAFPARDEARSVLSAAARHLVAGLGRFGGLVRHEYRGLTFRRVADRLRRELAANPARGRAAFVLAVLVWSSLAVWSRFLVPLATTPYSRPEPRFQVVGFFENGAGGFFVDSFPTLQRYPRLFDTVSPFWYSLSARGEVSGKGYREEVVRFARAHRLRLVPLVSNLKEDPGNSVDAIRDPAVRRRAVDALAAVARDRGFDGLNVSFELLPADARPSFTRFVQDLAAALHTQGRILAVSVFPDVEQPPEVSGVFDYRAIGQAADYVVLTAYDRHWSGTDPGPVAPLPWVEASVDSLLKYVARGKVVLAVGTHAYDWPVDAGAGKVEYLPTYAALDRAATVGAQVEYDAASRQSFYYYTSDTGAKRVVWVEDGGHLVDKAALARRKGLRGLGVWRLGFSEPGALERLAEALGRRP